MGDLAADSCSWWRWPHLRSAADYIPYMSKAMLKPVKSRMVTSGCRSEKWCAPGDVLKWMIVRLIDI